MSANTSTVPAGTENYACVQKFGKTCGQNGLYLYQWCQDCLAGFEGRSKSATPNLDYLREQVTELKALLDDPHPGLRSWLEMYGRRMTAISNFWNSKQ